MPKLTLFHIDILNNEYVTGWCFHRLLPWQQARVTVTRSGGNRRITSSVVSCSLKRQDVIDAGLHRSGRCGFLHVFEPSLSAEANASLTLTTNAGLVTLLDIPATEVKVALRPSKPAMFMHVPKTAGTSFNNHIQSWFGYRNWHIHIEALPVSSRKLLIKPAHYLAGHLPLYRLKEEIGELSAVDLHTFVREPLAQLHSHLAWLKGIGSDSNTGFLAEHPAVVQDLARRMQMLNLHDAHQLAGFVNQLDGFELEFFDNIQTRYFLDYRPRWVGERDIQQALRNRSLFATIGLTERFQEGIDRFARYYGRDPEPAGSRHNPTRVTPLFDQTDPAIVQALRPLIRFDRLLYEAIANDLRERD